MPTLVHSQSTPLKLPAGVQLTLMLTSPTTATVIELEANEFTPKTPVTVSTSPYVIGPFLTPKNYILVANSGAVTYTLGFPDPSSPADRVLGASGVAATGAADTNENILATITVPGGSLGPNGSLRIVTLWGVNNNVNVKTGRVRFSGIGGTVYGSIALASQVQGVLQTKISNRGSLASQVGGDAAVSFGVSTNALVTSSVDTSADTTVVITGQKATGGDTFRLDSYLVELMYAN